MIKVALLISNHSLNTNKEFDNFTYTLRLFKSDKLSAPTLPQPLNIGAMQPQPSQHIHVSPGLIISPIINGRINLLFHNSNNQTDNS